MDDAEWEASLAARRSEDEPADPELCPNPEDPPVPGEVDLEAIYTECREISADEARAAALAARLGTTGALAAGAASALGRRGPGMPGSARSFPGEYPGPAAGFASGMALDTAPGCAVLALCAGDAAGDDEAYSGVSDDELIGVICAWDRVQSHASARKHGAVAELIRRRPGPGCVLEGAARMPAVWDEFTPDELAPALTQSAWAVTALLDLSWDLEVKLPGTRAAFLSGVVPENKARIIAAATHLLDPEEARAAEALVLDRAGTLTPGGLRAAIARAVMQVAPDKARKRREEAARDARVERWAEDSGNAALVGRELPPAEVLAADQRVTWWAKQLKQAGLYGGPDDGGPGDSGSGPGEPRGHAPAGPAAGAIPPGFVGRVNLTITLPTLLGLADRPGEAAGIGPVDPALARDLARAAARNPRSTWCLTLTDQHGHAIGHGCARPARDQAKRHKPGARAGPDPPGRPHFAFTADDEHRAPSGYGTWRLSTGIPGQPDLIVTIEPITTDPCDHRREATGHDPGTLLRHLAQIRYATCTGPTCRRPAAQADFEHNIPYEAGGRTCLCNGGPKCRHDHRVKQHPRWKVEQLANGSVRWTTPAGRQYSTEPTRYPI